jgi:N-acetylmuramoyl-L-alanine amidase
MYRRSFLKYLSCGALGAYGLLRFPGLVWASAFDDALAGQNLIQKKRFAEAVAKLKAAVQKDPGSDWAYGLLGRAYLGLGQTAAAVTAFREAVRLNPDDTYSRMMIEIISQKPIRRSLKKKPPQTLLEKQAKHEEDRMAQKLRTGDGLRYRIKRVVIDAGHGGFDPGAVGASGLKEKDVTLDLALKLDRRLKQKGKVLSFLTRTGDYYIPLDARTATANQYQADMFISLHINASESRKPGGSETYFCSEKASSAEARKVAAFENSVLKFDEDFKQQAGYIDIEKILLKIEQQSNWEKSGMFAGDFQKRFKERLPLKSRGVHSANFYVLRRTKMPSILLEAGFISNPKEESMLKQAAFREKIVDAVALGIDQWI